MLKIDLYPKAAKFLKKRNVKEQKQLAKRIISLAKEPYPHWSKQLSGKHHEYYRATAGEFRIIYRLIENTVVIYVIGNRNDSDVYKEFNRLMQ